MKEGYNRTISILVEKLSKNGQEYPDSRPSAVVNVATDWFTEAGLENLSKCTVGFYNECIISIIRRKDNLVLSIRFTIYIYGRNSWVNLV